MDNRRVYILVCATGRTLFWKKNAAIAMPAISTMSGRIHFINDTPEAFMAVSSNRSPRFPNVISEASSMASGSAIGIIVSAA